MSTTADQKKATNTYRKKKYSLQVSLPKEYQERLKNCAKKRHESVNQFVKSAIDDVLEKEQGACDK